jgi:hypothetical protein
MMAEVKKSPKSRKKAIKAPSPLREIVGDDVWVAMLRWLIIALATDNDLSCCLSSYSREEFKDWLDRIDQGGSVTG